MDTKVTESAVIDPKEADKLCRVVQSVLTGMSWDDRKKVLSDIIERIVIYDSGQVEIKGCLPIFNQKVGYGASDRNCRFAQRGQVHLV